MAIAGLGAFWRRSDRSKDHAKPGHRSGAVSLSDPEGCMSAGGLETSSSSIDDNAGVGVAGVEETSHSVAAALRDIFLSPVVAYGITAGLLFLCTWCIYWLRATTGYDRPYTILYLIPVAVGSAFLGFRGGVVASAVSLMLVRIYFLNDHRYGLALAEFPTLAESLDFVTLAAGTMSIAFVTGRLRFALSLIRVANRRLEESNLRLEIANAQLEAANGQILDNERQRRQFNRDVLLAVTGGKLRLVERGELPPTCLSLLPPRLQMRLSDSVAATRLRQLVHGAANGTSLDAARLDDLLTATTEAATNAVKHGGGGRSTVWVTESCVTVLVEDNGRGIPADHLARATLEKGYSTLVSLGMGFHLMLECADSLSLSTGETGTAVMLEVSNRHRASDGEALLARYPQL